MFGWGGLRLGWWRYHRRQWQVKTTELGLDWPSVLWKRRCPGWVLGFWLENGKAGLGLRWGTLQMTRCLGTRGMVSLVLTVFSVSCLPSFWVWVSDRGPDTQHWGVEKRLGSSSLSSHSLAYGRSQSSGCWGVAGDALG